MAVSDALPETATMAKGGGVTAVAAGALEATTGAVSKGLRVATQKLTQLQDMLGEVSGNAAEALGKALSNLGGPPETPAGLMAVPDVLMQLFGGVL